MRNYKVRLQEQSLGNRRERCTRPLRQLLLAGITALGCVSTGTDAAAQENRQAFYTAHPSEMKNKVRTVGGDDPQPVLQSILLTQAFQELESEEPIASSSDLEVESELEPRGDLEPTPDLEPIRDGETSELPAPLSEEDADEVAGDDEVFADPPLAAPVVESFPFDEGLIAPAPPVYRSTGRSLGATAGGYSAAPSMMGDFFGGTFSIGSPQGHSAALAGGDRRFKIAENSSPIPQDRVFFNYNHFHNALRDINDVNQNLDRFTFGLEKTFLSGIASVDFRVPFASALDSTQRFGSADTTATEFGNLSTTLKVKLLSGCDWLLSGGASMIFPTGDDAEYYDGPRRELLIQNEAYHLAPYLGLVKSNCAWFAQGFIQADFDLNGNDVFTDLFGFEGVIQDQNLLYMDVAVGHWFLRSCDPCNPSGVAAIAELHYTTTMNDADSVAFVSNEFNRMDILNATGALHFQRRATSLRIGVSAPLRGDEENLFDTEILVQLNHNL